MGSLLQLCTAKMCAKQTPGRAGMGKLQSEHLIQMPALNLMLWRPPIFLELPPISHWGSTLPLASAIMWLIGNPHNRTMMMMMMMITTFSVDTQLHLVHAAFDILFARHTLFRSLVGLDNCCTCFCGSSFASGLQEFLDASRLCAKSMDGRMAVWDVLDGSQLASWRVGVCGWS